VKWNGTSLLLVGFRLMNISLSQLLEESFQIAWEYLERTGELGDGAVASRFLSDTIETMIRRGQRSRLVLSNRAVRLLPFPKTRGCGIQAGVALVGLRPPLLRRH
jgi:hypothetical protein